MNVDLQINLSQKLTRDFSEIMKINMVFITQQYPELTKHDKIAIGLTALKYFVDHLANDNETFRKILIDSLLEPSFFEHLLKEPGQFVEPH